MLLWKSSIRSSFFFSWSGSNVPFIHSSVSANRSLSPGIVSCISSCRPSVRSFVLRLAVSVRSDSAHFLPFTSFIVRSSRSVLAAIMSSSLMRRRFRSAQSSSNRPAIFFTLISSCARLTTDWGDWNPVRSYSVFAASVSARNFFSASLILLVSESNRLNRAARKSSYFWLICLCASCTSAMVLSSMATN